MMKNAQYWTRQHKKYFGSKRAVLKSATLIATIFFVILLVGVFMIGAVFAWYAKDLPRPDKVQRLDGLSTVILDRKGDNLYDIFVNQNRLPVKWEDVPEYLKKGTIAVEDKDFYKHKGLSTTGILRAIIQIFVFRNFQGGSTLTQQLVKTVLLTQDRVLSRKIKEAILSIQIERKYTKDQILHMYLNEVPYGGTAVGVESASQYYFGKPVKELQLVECAFLSGLPQSPSRYSPFTGDGESYKWRTEQVLRRMREDGYISTQQEVEAKKQIQKLTFVDTSVGLKAPHFVAYVKDLLIKQFGSDLVEGGGLKVTTSLDAQLQDKAQIIVADEVSKAKNLKVTNGAAVILDPKTGEILAMVGSKDYSSTESGGFKFNVATQGLRQPGSTMKPFMYAALLKKGYSASTVLLDVDTKYPSGDIANPEYNPKNYDGKYRGPMQLRYALANSVNTIAVKVQALVGTKEALETAYDFGLKTLEPTNENMKRFGLSLTLGGGEVKLLELTSAYGVFATQGKQIDPVAILKVEDSKGKILYQYSPPNPQQIFPSGVSYIINAILSDNESRKAVFGERSYLVIPGKTVAVKTGTTDDKRDNWTVGYTPSRVIGVWVGNNDNSPMNPALASGITGAAPIWNRLMKESLIDKKDEPFPKPDDVMELEIDAFGGGLPVEGYSKRKEYFVKGTEPTSQANIYQKVKVSRKDNNKLASQADVINNNYDSKTFVIFTEQDPVSGDGKNRWQEGIDSWIAAQGDSKYHPPKEVDNSSSPPLAISIKKPTDKARVNANDVEVRIEIAAINQITKVELLVDGTKVKERSTNDRSITETIHMDNGMRDFRVRVFDDKGLSAEQNVKIGINEDYKEPTPVLTATLTPVPTVTLTLTPTP